LNEAGVIIARNAAELEGLQQSVQQLDSQCETLESERRRLEEQHNDALARADSMEEDDAAIQQALADAQDHASHARQALAERTSETSDLRVRFAELTQQLDEADRNRLREQQEYEDAVRNADRRVEQAQQLKQNQASLESEIEVNIDRAKALSENTEEARKLVVEARNEYETLRAENETLAKALREMHEQERTVQAEVHRLEMDLRHDEDQAGFLEERILAEYHVALSSLDAEAVGADEYDDETREELITDARDKLERMGQVNVMAIEEYEALEQRHDFLATQEEDLRKAREALLGVVERIDKTICDMFLETFTKVADSFRTYFRRLFNGGQARIYLVDENDPLESGIEIEARPPGKKPQTISLLSGGEQAMTAIALLFSIFRAKPSPFCVLDEVDAPLDDANIGRFLDMVQEFTSESQFIIITHSKQTMARANILYGVTMQERGVSQLVSVRCPFVFAEYGIHGESNRLVELVPLLLHKLAKCHAALFHHPGRSPILDDRCRSHLLEFRMRVKGPRKNGATRLGHQPPVPELLGKRIVNRAIRSIAQSEFDYANDARLFSQPDRPSEFARWAADKRCHEPCRILNGLGRPGPRELENVRV
ncbi:MAG: AAA family ATPase, partial [Candidatus Hydrogenedentes bacterium]|nr:AAA family ATPase [Candidatus Hydrogenedentota bacterium]